MILFYLHFCLNVVLSFSCPQLLKNTPKSWIFPSINSSQPFQLAWTDYSAKNGNDFYNHLTFQAGIWVKSQSKTSPFITFVNQKKSLNSSLCFSNNIWDFYITDRVLAKDMKFRKDKPLLLEVSSGPSKQFISGNSIQTIPFASGQLFYSESHLLRLRDIEQIKTNQNVTIAWSNMNEESGTQVVRVGVWVKNSFKLPSQHFDVQISISKINIIEGKRLPTFAIQHQARLSRSIIVNGIQMDLWVVEMNIEESKLCTITVFVQNDGNFYTGLREYPWGFGSLEVPNDKRTIIYL
ncbi:hypothetical protein BC833DRAFT_590564 [Globomyces pollinis-pini]|nr:hypothetical protein BC833DRAFT_590564 [Globomyces pollinis-pini]